jgi:hypothetical protein
MADVESGKAGEAPVAGDEPGSSQTLLEKVVEAGEITIDAGQGAVVKTYEAGQAMASTAFGAVGTAFKAFVPLPPSKPKRKKGETETDSESSSEPESNTPEVRLGLYGAWCAGW